MMIPDALMDEPRRLDGSDGSDPRVAAFAHCILRILLICLARLGVLSAHWLRHALSCLSRLAPGFPALVEAHVRELGHHLVEHRLALLLLEKEAIWVHPAARHGVEGPVLRARRTGATARDGGAAERVRGARGETIREARSKTRLGHAAVVVF